MEQEPKCCVFCGKDESFGPMDTEHFVPRALWDNQRPIHTKTVPAHKSCNQSYSDDNEYFRDILIMEEGANTHPEVKKLRDGKLARKFQNRFGSIKKTLKNVSEVEIVTPRGLYVGRSPAFQVDRTRINRVLYNVMRGIFYTVTRRPLPLEWNWEVKAIEEVDAEGLKPLFNQMTPSWQTFGDDVFMCRYVFDYERGGMSCLMRFYCRRIFIGWAFSDEFIRSQSEHIQKSLLIRSPG